MDFCLTYSTWLAQLEPDTDKLFMQFSDGSQVEFIMSSHETRVVPAADTEHLQPVLPNEPSID